MFVLFVLFVAVVPAAAACGAIFALGAAYEQGGPAGLVTAAALLAAVLVTAWRV